MRRLAYLLLFLVLVAAAFFVVDRYIVPLAEEKRQQNGGPTISSQVLEEETALVSIQVEYPITHTTAVNRSLELFAREQIETFKAWADETGPLPEERKYGLWLQFEAIEGPLDLISFVFTLSVDTGGAHPNHVIVTKVYDFATNEEITAGDVFNTENLGPLSEFAANELQGFLGATDESGQKWIAEGSGPILANFEAFSLNKDGVAIYYSPYQVAPYAQGGQVILIPYNIAREGFTESFAKEYDF